MKVDYSYVLENITPINKLRRVILSVTYDCNSKCKTCFIWKEKRPNELSLEDFRNLANKEEFKQVRFLTLTGGETFLRMDIDEIVNIFKKANPKLHITLLSNALMPELMYKKVKNMPKDVAINLSLNGNEETHDDVRGVKGNFKTLIRTIEYMKKLNRRTSLIFTVSKENHDQLLWAWNFAKFHNVNIMFSPEMDYARLSPEEGRGLFDHQKELVLKQLRKIYAERRRPFFDDTYYLFFKKFYNNETVTNNCYAGTNSVFINFTGEVYACENLVDRSTPLGNIKEGFLLPKNYQEVIEKSKCYENCFLLCEMVRNLRKHPIKTLVEIRR
jgi:MoaA/NifB/PqqE/SkfB family radical SAM enzyme